jgi:opacity protein-like surface antigen
MRPSGRAALLAAAVFAFLTGTSYAAGERQLTRRLAGGSCFPVHSELLTDLHSSGLNLEGGVGALLPIGIRVYGAYDFNSLFVDEQGVTEYVESQDPSFDTGSVVDANPTRIHTAMAVAFVPLTKTVAAKPYVLCGIGWMWVSAGDITYSGGTLGGSEDSGFATALGGGIDFRAGPTINVFVEAVWYVGFTEGNTTQIIPLRIGVYR